MTGIENKIYPTEIYNTFTPAQKAKHWQLKFPGQTPGTGPAKATIGAATAPGIPAKSLSSRQPCPRLQQQFPTSPQRLSGLLTMKNLT